MFKAINTVLFICIATAKISHMISTRKKKLAAFTLWLCLRNKSYFLEKENGDLFFFSCPFKMHNELLYRDWILNHSMYRKTNNHCKYEVNKQTLLLTKCHYNDLWGIEKMLFHLNKIMHLIFISKFKVPIV